MKTVGLVLAPSVLVALFGCQSATKPPPSPSSPSAQLGWIANDRIRQTTLAAAGKTVSVQIRIPDDDLYEKKGKTFLFRRREDIDSLLKSFLASRRRQNRETEPGGEGERGIGVELLDKEGEHLESYNLLQDEIYAKWGPEVHAWLEKHLGIPLK